MTTIPQQVSNELRREGIAQRDINRALVALGAPEGESAMSLRNRIKTWLRANPPKRTPHH